MTAPTPLSRTTRVGMPLLENSSAVCSPELPTRVGEILLSWLLGTVSKERTWSGLGNYDVELLGLGSLQHQSVDYTGSTVHQYSAVVRDEATAQVGDHRPRVQGHARKSLTSPQKLCLTGEKVLIKA